MKVSHWLRFLSVLFFPLCLLSAEPQGFQQDVNLGLTLNRGNSENTTLSLGFASRFRQEDVDWSLQATYQYGDSTVRDRDGGGRQTTTNLDKTTVESQANILYSPRTYFLVGASYLRDRISDIDYRVIGGPGIGHFLIRNDHQSLSVELGLSYLFEEVRGVRDDYEVIRVAQRFEQRFGDHAEIWQSLEYLPEASEFSNYLLNAEIGAKALLNGNLSLRIVLRNRYDNVPSENQRKNDTSLISGISYRF